MVVICIICAQTANVLYWNVWVVPYMYKHIAKSMRVQASLRFTAGICKEQRNSMNPSTITMLFVIKNYKATVDFVYMQCSVDEIALLWPLLRYL